MKNKRFFSRGESARCGSSDRGLYQERLYSFGIGKLTAEIGYSVNYYMLLNNFKLMVGIRYDRKEGL